MSSLNDAITSWLRLTATSNNLPHLYWTYAKCLSALIWCEKAYSCSLMKFYPPYLAKILGFWVTCQAEMMPLHHGWGWQPPQTTSPIHIRHIQSVWVHWYDVKRHTVAALCSSTHPTWRRFWGSGSHVEPKWCHYVTVEADSHLKQLLPSTLDIYKVFEHIDVLFKGIQLQPYEVLPTLIG